MATKRNQKKGETISDLIRLTDKENPKPEDLQRFRERLEENDTLVRLNESSEQAFNRVIRTFTKSAAVKELFERQIKAKRKALDYESESVIVQMLINHLILCHIRLSTYEAFHAEKTQESLSIASGIYWDKLLSNYQRRFHKACESLAKVKCLLSEAELRDQQARRKRSQSTLDSQKLYKALTD